MAALLRRILLLLVPLLADSCRNCFPLASYGRIIGEAISAEFDRDLTAKLITKATGPVTTQCVPEMI